MLLTGNTLLTNPAIGTALDAIIDEASVSGMQTGAETLALRPDYRPLLPTIAVPTLVLEGVDDGVYAYPDRAVDTGSYSGLDLVADPERRSRQHL